MFKFTNLLLLAIFPFSLKVKSLGIRRYIFLFPPLPQTCINCHFWQLIGAWTSGKVNLEINWQITLNQRWGNRNVSVMWNISLIRRLPEVKKSAVRHTPSGKEMYAKYVSINGTYSNSNNNSTWQHEKCLLLRTINRPRNTGVKEWSVSFAAKPSEGRR